MQLNEHNSLSSLFTQNIFYDFLLHDDALALSPSVNFKALPHFQWHLPFFLRVIIKYNVV